MAEGGAQEQKEGEFRRRPKILETVLHSSHTQPLLRRNNSIAGLPNQTLLTPPITIPPQPPDSCNKRD